jgi:hypothetical protein
VVRPRGIKRQRERVHERTEALKHHAVHARRRALLYTLHIMNTKQAEPLHQSDVKDFIMHQRCVE